MTEYYNDEGAQSESLTGNIAKMPCKRDFEFEINKHKDRLTKQEAVLLALESLLDNHEGDISKLPIKKLIGTAYVRTYEQKRNIAMLIKEQEATGG